VRENLTNSVNVTLNDAEVDGQTLVIQSCDDGAHGTTTEVGGTVTYTHSGLSRLDDQFDCVVTDGGLTETTTVFVDVIYCGDGAQQAPEECDDGNLNNCDACTNACKVGPNVKMVNISGGPFTMGDSAFTASSPTRVVTVPSFQVSRAEISVAQYRACVRAGGCSAAATTSGCTYRATAGTNDARPVNCVSWDQATQFAAWCLNDPDFVGTALSLPTEAQWEYLAKGGANQLYPSGNTVPSSRTQAVYNTTAPVNVCTVGVKTVAGLRVQGPFNLCNLVGNVSEWTRDNYAAYSNTSPVDGSAVVIANNYNVVRGGSWSTARTSNLTSAYRLPLLRSQRRPEVGFRVACPAQGTCAFTGEAP